MSRSSTSFQSANGDLAEKQPDHATLIHLDVASLPLILEVPAWINKP
jgi:hypothetical protein